MIAEYGDLAGIVRFVRDTSLGVVGHADGWVTQQVLKLLVANIVERRVARALGLLPRALTPLERRAFSSLALVLDLIPDLSRWPRAERVALAGVVLAKVSRYERRYLRRMQKHERLRRALIRLGSRTGDD